MSSSSTTRVRLRSSLAREDEDEDEDDEEEEVRGCWTTETVWTWRIFCGSAYTGSGVFAAPLIELNEGDDDDDDDDEEDDDDDDILLSFSTSSGCGSAAETRDGCLDFELMIDPYSVSDSSL